MTVHIEQCQSALMQPDERVQRGGREGNALATGWFQPSVLLGTWSPSTQRLTSSHHGVLVRHGLSLSSFAASTSSTHRDARVATRAPIQSIVRPARCSSSSRVAASISGSSEKRRANEACGTEVRVVVRVVTAARNTARHARTDVQCERVVMRVYAGVCVRKQWRFGTRSNDAVEIDMPLVSCKCSANDPQTNLAIAVQKTVEVARAVEAMRCSGAPAGPGTRVCMYAG